MGIGLRVMGDELVCTGIYLLARSGYLSGERATTNKAAYKTYMAGPIHARG